jgi:hypothetical protein
VAVDQTLRVIEPQQRPGDFNADGIVDAADYLVWRNGSGTTYTQDDYNTWRTHFGQTAGSASSADTNAAVPEPANGFVLFITAIFGIYSRIRGTTGASRSFARVTAKHL